jgi:phosphate acyltransferase
LRACEDFSCFFTVLVSPDLLAVLPSHPKVLFHPCTEVITMQDHPLHSIRMKKNASMVRGLNLLKDEKVEAFLSCGNTGALIAGSALFLPLKPGVERPALLARLLKKNGDLFVLDVGGNLEVNVEQIEQNALMGIDHLLSLGKKQISMGLLNIGSESLKGTLLVRESYQRLFDRFKGDQEIDFVGNIEGRDPFDSDLDLLVTDGFTGNVFLKTAEGATSMLIQALEEKGIHLPLAIKHSFDYRSFGGALVCGVEGIVIKCHGNATAQHVYRSIEALCQ